MKKIILGAFLFLTTISNIQAQAPANDNCSNAINLTVGVLCTTGTSVNSTFDGTMPSCGGNNSTGNVWYKFTATSALSRIEVTSASGIDVELAVYPSCGAASAQCIDIGIIDEDESLSIPTVIGSIYYVAVKQFDASAGTFCVAVNNVTPPANDDCANAISLTVGSACLNGTTLNSSFDGTMPSSCGGNNSTGNVWYKFVATSTLSRIDVTSVSTLDAILAIYASCGGSSIYCADDGAEDENELLIIPTVIGTTYYINIKQFDVLEGTFCVAVNNVIPPANDNCSNAINLTVGSACLTGTSVSSSFDGTMPSCGGTNSSGNVWYKFTATSVQSKIEVTSVSGLDISLSVHSSCGGPSTHCSDIGNADQDESLSVPTVIGTTYYINIKQYDGSEGTFCVAVSNIVPPVNDNCTNAISLTVGAPCTAGTTVNSSFDGTMPSCGGTNTTGNVWYSFVATGAQTKIDVTSVLGFDAVLSVYSSCGGASINCDDNGYDDDNESSIISTVIGSTYFINVKQYDIPAGTFCIAVSNIVALANDNCANAINLAVGAPCVAGTTVNSSFDGIVPSCGGTNTTGNVWYSFTATTAQSRIDVTSSVGLDVELSVYNSCGGASSQCADFTGFESDEFLTISTIIGNTYFINVKQYDASAGTFCIAVSNVIPPANDNCSNATNLTVGAVCTSGTTVNSIFDGTMPSCGGSSAVGNVWYKFTATSVQSRIDVTSVSGLDIVLSVHASCGGASTQCTDIGILDEEEYLSVSTVIGTTYYINVKQQEGSEGTFCIAVSNIIPPVNDNCANAINLTIGAPCTAGTTVNSSFDGIMPSCGGTNATGNVWYSFTATAVQTQIAVTSVLGFDAVLSVYDLCGGASIKCDDVGYDDDNESAIISTVIGTTYFINVKQYNISDGTFCIAVSNVAPPVNDNCSNAIAITVNDPCLAGTTVSSSLDGIAPSCGGFGNDGNVWYKFVAIDVQTKVDLTNLSGLDGVLAIYDLCGGASIQCSNSGLPNGNESITFSTVIGTTYLINVKQYDAFAGTFCISATSGSSIVEFANKISYYPNPLSDFLVIENSNFNKPVTALITNVLGQTVKSVVIQKNKEIINFSELKNGTYYVKIEDWNFNKMIIKK